MVSEEEDVAEAGEQEEEAQDSGVKEEEEEVEEEEEGESDREVRPANSRCLLMGAGSAAFHEATLSRAKTRRQYVSEADVGSSSSVEEGVLRHAARTTQSVHRIHLSGRHPVVARQARRGSSGVVLGRRRKRETRLGCLAASATRRGAAAPQPSRALPACTPSRAASSQSGAAARRLTRSTPCVVRVLASPQQLDTVPVADGDAAVQRAVTSLAGGARVRARDHKLGARLVLELDGGQQRRVANRVGRVGVRTDVQQRREAARLAVTRSPINARRLPSESRAPAGRPAARAQRTRLPQSCLAYGDHAPSLGRRRHRTQLGVDAPGGPGAQVATLGRPVRCPAPRPGAP